MKLYEAKEAEFPEAEQIRELERVVLLKVIDSKWMDHIDDMEQSSSGYRSCRHMAREIRLVEYKMQGYEMFDEHDRQPFRKIPFVCCIHVHVEQKVEREQVAKVTGTNKDDTSAKSTGQRNEDKGLSE